MIKRLLLAVVVFLLIASGMPETSVSAAPVGQNPNPGRDQDGYPRLEKAFQRVQDWHEKQGEFLEEAEDCINKAETFIGKAEQRGLDASALRSLLEDFESSIPLVQAAHNRAGAILSAHHGFDDLGKVTDAETAAQTIKAAASALQEGRQAHLGKGKALAEAIRAFWRNNKPAKPTTTIDALLPPPSE